MAILTVQIANRVKGPMAENEDWWWLCYDTETQKFCVKHGWDHVQINGLQQRAGEAEHNADTWQGPGSDKIPSAKMSLLERANA
jgi:hypothetical protein